MASLIRRNKIFYLQYRAGSKLLRKSLQTENKQIAQEKLRQFESARLQGEDIALPTKTPLSEALQAYLNHIRAVKSPNSVIKDANILRLVFGPVVRDLEQISRKKKARVWTRRRPVSRNRRPIIEGSFVEQVTTHMVSHFIDASVRQR